MQYIAPCIGDVVSIAVAIYSYVMSLITILNQGNHSKSLPKMLSGILPTVELVYYGHLGTKKCPDYQGVLIFQIALYDRTPFGTITKCVDYAGILIFKCPD